MTTPCVFIVHRLNAVLHLLILLDYTLIAYLIRLQSWWDPSVLLQSTAGVIIGVGMSLVDVGRHLCLATLHPAHVVSLHHRLQLHLSRHRHIRLSFAEI